MKLVCTNYSNTLDKIGKIEMGLKLFLSISESDLCSGNTFAYFHSESIDWSCFNTNSVGTEGDVNIGGTGGNMLDQSWPMDVKYSLKKFAIFCPSTTISPLINNPFDITLTFPGITSFKYFHIILSLCLFSNIRPFQICQWAHHQ